MKVKASMAEVLEPFAKFIEVAGAAAKGHGHFHAFAKIEPLETRLRCKLRLCSTEIADYTAKIGPQGGNRSIIANIEGRELLGQVIPVCGGERPLREIVGEPFREEVVGSQGLECVMKDGSVAAVFEAGQQFREGSSRLNSNAREIGSGYKVEWCFGDTQSSVLSTLRCTKTVSV